MKFLANENVPLASVILLRQRGIDVTYAAEDCRSNRTLGDNPLSWFRIRPKFANTTFIRFVGTNPIIKISCHLIYVLCLVG
jgi:hypothetical protein